MVDSQVLQAIRPWVEHKLSPISEHEPKVLTDYVIALLSHDMPLEELEKECNTQLQDFLHEHTGPFVGELMQELRNVLNGGSTKPEEYRPEQAQVGGQEHFRNNFRDRDMNQGPQGGQGSAFQHPDQPPAPAGVWSNGVFIPSEAMPLPNNQGFIPPFDMNQPPQFFNNMGFQGPPRGGGGGRGRGRGGARRGGYRQYGRGGAGGAGGSALDAGIATSRDDDTNSKRKLVVDKIPEDRLNESDIRNYFGQFGTITELTVNPEHKSAILEFESHDQARAAWQSPQVIFDNRFVKVYWHKERRTDGTDSPYRRNGPHGPHGQQNPEPPIDLEEFKKRQEEKQKEFEQKKALREQHEAKMRELLETKAKILEQRRQKQEQLLQIAQSQGNAADVEEKKASTEALQQQLDALRAEAASLGVDQSQYAPGSGAGSGAPALRGRDGFRGRGRGRGRGGNPAAAFGRATLDLRPRGVLVWPIPQGQEEAFRSYVLSRSEYEDIQRTDAKPDGAVIVFKDRRTAEQFYNSSNDIPEVGKIEKAWQRVESNNDVMDTA